jgi:hypothetical protein
MRKGDEGVSLIFLWIMQSVPSVCCTVRSQAAARALSQRKVTGEVPEIKEIAGVKFQVDARPALGQPFHLAFPVHDFGTLRSK